MLKNTSTLSLHDALPISNGVRDIPRYDAWTVARVVGWACVKHHVAVSPCFHSHSVLIERPFTHSSKVYFVEHSQLHM